MKTVTETLREMEQEIEGLGREVGKMKWPIRVETIEKVLASFAVYGLCWSLFAAGAIPVLFALWGWLERVL